MINPEILASLFISYISSLYLLYSSVFSLKILKKWNLINGSEYQINLEKRVYLIQTIVFWMMIVSFIGLFHFIYLIDKLCIFIAGAMCGFGTLSANIYGWATFLLKIFIVIFSGAWIILNKIDYSFEYYPLIKIKSAFLLVITPFFILDSTMSTLFFLNIKPDIVVSCCGSFFEEFSEINKQTNLNLILNNRYLTIIFISYQILTIIFLTYLIKNKKCAIFTSFVNFFNIFLLVIYFLFFISPYIYELPNHYCFFCILKMEYYGVGYLYYLVFLTYSITTVSLMLISLTIKLSKNKEFLIKYQRKLAFQSIYLLLGLLFLFTLSVIISNLKLNY